MQIPTSGWESVAFLYGSRGISCRTATLAELAAWFQGFAYYARQAVLERTP